MKYQLVRSSDCFYQVLLEDAPSNCKSLEMAPIEMENNLKVGKWAVLLVAVWSGPHVAQIGVALDFATRSPTRQVGIRPYNEDDELVAWLPDFDARRSPPVWVFLDGGRLREWSETLLSREQLTRLA